MYKYQPLCNKNKTEICWSVVMQKWLNDEKMVKEGLQQRMTDVIDFMWKYGMCFAVFKMSKEIIDSSETSS